MGVVHLQGLNSLAYRNQSLYKWRGPAEGTHLGYLFGEHLQRLVRTLQMH